MNAKDEQVHAANQMRIHRERAAMAARFVVIVPRVRVSSERFSRGVADATKRETRERSCLRCEVPFKSTGAHHRMCCDCSRLPEGYGL